MLVGTLFLINAAHAGALGEAIWWRTYTHDLPPDFFAEGTYEFLWEWGFSYTFPEPNSAEGLPAPNPDVQPGPFVVTEDAPMYPGFVVLGLSGVYALTDPEGPECQTITAFHPDQPTRLRVSWGIDDPSTPEVEPVRARFAWALFRTLTNTATPVGGDTVEMVGHDFLPLGDDPAVLEAYLCTFLINEYEPAA